MLHTLFNYDDANQLTISGELGVGTTTYTDDHDRALARYWYERSKAAGCQCIQIPEFD